MNFVCSICKRESVDHFSLPFHIKGGFTVQYKKATGCILCDWCLTIQDEEATRALNLALELSIGD